MAVLSLLEHWNGLTRFLEDPRIPVENNAGGSILSRPTERFSAESCGARSRTRSTTAWSPALSQDGPGGSDPREGATEPTGVAEAWVDGDRTLTFISRCPGQTIRLGVNGGFVEKCAADGSCPEGTTCLTPLPLAPGFRCFGTNARWTALAEPWAAFAKQGCPTAYSFPFDDATSTFTCNTAGASESNPNTKSYTITFCPGGLEGGAGSY